MILFLKQIVVDFFIKCSFFSFSYMYFHTAYCKFTTMKILIIIFCNKIERGKIVRLFDLWLPFDRVYKKYRLKNIEIIDMTEY